MLLAVKKMNKKDALVHCKKWPFCKGFLTPCVDFLSTLKKIYWPKIEDSQANVFRINQVIVFKLSHLYSN